MVEKVVRKKNLYFLSPLPSEGEGWGEGDKRRKYMNILENILEKNNLKEGYKLLTKREKKVINLYYLEGYRDEDIAKLYGVCRQSVNESRQKGIKKLKYF